MDSISSKFHSILKFGNKYLNIFALFIILLISCTAQAQKLYIKTFGEKGDTPLIFLHGGPGYNSASFEFSTAEELAKKGFFVVVYDRRGEGRSTDNKAEFTFKESTKDLKKICASLKLKKVNLLGHSFGGMIATEFAKKYSKKVQSIILIGAPLNLQESFKTIIATAKKQYTQKKDSLFLQSISLVEKADTNSIMYASSCFQFAMMSGAYNTKEPSPQAMELYKKCFQNAIFKKYAAKMTTKPVSGFWKNEHYTTLNITQDIINLKNSGVPYFGLYGKEDGLYSSQQIEELKNLIGTKNVEYLDNCSHAVFIDQQELFIECIIKWTKK